MNSETVKIYSQGIQVLIQIRQKMTGKTPISWLTETEASVVT